MKKKKKITLCTDGLLHSLGSNGMEAEESFDHDVRQQVERVSMIGGDRQSFMPTVEFAVFVMRAIHAIHLPVVQKIHVLISHLVK